MIAELLGMPLQPWQRHALDIAGELVPDETGELVHAYSSVTLSVGRRGGKSLLTLVRLVNEIMAGRRRFAFYAAQNGKAGAERFRNDWVPLVSASASVLAQRLTPRLTNGTETLTDRGLMSYLRIFSPIPSALHGDAADAIVFDEAWAHTADRGRDLEVAAFPLMATRPGAQLWIMSAAGDSSSEWWSQWLADGRAAAAADQGRGHCHLEWTAEGDSRDHADETLWLDAHPGIRHAGNPEGVIMLDYLRAEHARDPGQFARSYLNITDRTGTTSTPIDLEQWQALGTAAPDRGLISLGVDVAPDQTSAAIVAAHVVDGATVLEVLDARGGHTWLPDRVAEICQRYAVQAVALDAGGQSPASVLRRPLEARGVPLRCLGLADATAAAADFVAAARGGQVRNVPHLALDQAVEAARRRPIGDGAWLWGRRSAEADVSPLIAATYARWCHPEALGATPGGIG